MKKYQLAGFAAAVVGFALALTASATTYNFATNLKMGMTSADVKNLQVVLNSSSDTQVAATGVGSAGMESSYFGALTKAAVMKFQTKYASEVLAPAGLTAPTGFVGPSTRTKLNSMTTGTATTVPGCTSTSGFSTTTGQSCAGSVSTTLPAGCTSTSGFSPVTGQSCATSVTPSGTGAVLVTLASTNLSGGNLVNGQATAELAQFTFTGSGTVSSVSLQRTGISDQNDLTNVYLYDGVTRITDGYSFNQSGMIVMNGLNIVVNGSKTISVKADVAIDAANTNATIGVTLTGYTVNGVATTASVVGNLNYNVVGSLAGVTVGANTVNAATVNAGTSSYTFWSAPVQINTRAVYLKAASFRMVGSAPSDALSGVHMFIDGVDTGVVATLGTVQGSNYLSFDLTSAPTTLQTGSHTIDVRATINKGSARTVQVSLQQAADLMVTDTQLGVNVAAVGSPTALPSSGGVISIAAGSATLVLDPTFQAATNVSGGATNVAIGKFKLHAYGEDVKVTSLSVLPVLGATTAMAPVLVAPDLGTLDQVALYFNGSQIASSQQFTGGALLFQLGSQMVVPAGTDSTLEVRANLRSAASVNYTGGSVSVTVQHVTGNAQGQLSLTSVDVPTAAVVGNTLSVQTGTLQIAKNVAYADQTASPNTTGVKIGSFVLQNQSTSESVRVTSLVVKLGGSTALTNLSALRTSETSGSGATPQQPQSTNTFAVDFTLAPGATKTIDVLADTSTATASASTLASLASGATMGVSTNTAVVHGVTTVTAQAQIETATLTGIAGTYGITVNGITYATAFNGTLAQTSTDLAALVNADAAVSAAKGTGNTVVVTARTAGTAFTYSNLGTVPSNQLVFGAETQANRTAVVGATATGKVTLSGTPSVGDVIHLTVQAEPVSYTVLAGDIGTTNAATLTNLAVKVAALSGGTIGAANNTMTSALNVVTITGAANSDVPNGYALTTSVTPKGATVQTNLVATYLGVTSNVTGTNGPAGVDGQTISLATGTVTTPTTANAIVSSTSTSAQYIASASGATNASKVTYNFSSVNGPSTITELTFDLSTNGSTAGAVSSITINNQVAPVVGNVAYVTGLNIAVPNGGSGVNQDVYVTYAPVGTNGVVSGAVSTLELTTVKYTSGGTTATLGGPVGNGTLAVDAAQMTLVGSKPTVALTLPGGVSGQSQSGLATGTIEVADVTVSADAQGDLKVNTIPLKFTGSAAGVTVQVNTDTDIAVKDASGAAITGYTIANRSGGANQNATGTITFATGYLVPKGTTATFKIYAIVSATGTGVSLATGLNGVTNFTWTDTAGAATTVTAATTGATTTMPGFPSGTVSLVNN